MYRRYRSGQFSSEELSIFLRAYAAHSNEEYLLVPYSESLVDLAGGLIAKHPLRTLDAIQLAAALWLRAHLPRDAPSPIFLSADDRLVEWARLEHLQAENP